MKKTRAREILDVSGATDESDLEAAYREKVKAHHPDVSDDPDARGKFRKVQEAKETLERFRQQQRTADRERTGADGASDDRKRRNRSGGEGTTGRAETGGRRAASNTSDGYYSARSRWTTGGTDQRVGHGADTQSAGSGRSRESAASTDSSSWTGASASRAASGRAYRRGERSDRTSDDDGDRSRTRREPTAETATESADSQPSGGRPLLRLGQVVGVGSLSFLALLLALAGAAALFPAPVTAVVFVAGVGGLAWAGNRVPRSTVVTMYLLGLSAAGLLPSVPFYSPSPTIPTVSAYSPLGIDMVLAVPTVGAAVGIASRLARGGGDQSTEGSSP